MYGLVTIGIVTIQLLIGIVAIEEGVAAFGNESVIAYSCMYGVDFVLPSNDRIISHYLRYYGQYEKPYLDLFISIFRPMFEKADKKFVIVDIGSNVGAWSIPLAKVIGSRGYVYAIDAQRDLVNYVSATAVLNSLHNIFTVNAIASNVSDGSTNLYYTNNDGEIVFNYGGLSIEMLSGETKIKHGVLRTDSTYSVQHRTLDDMLLKDKIFECPSFVKLDIEGHELFAIIGGKRLLRDCQPILFVEAWCKYQLKSVFVALASLGYSLAWIVLPTIDPVFEHFGRSFWTSDEMKDLSFQQQLEKFVLSQISPNIVAIPSSYAASYFSEFNNILYPIDLSDLHNLQVAIEDSKKASFCINERFERVLISDNQENRTCTVLEHSNDSNCFGSSSDPFIENYWFSILNHVDGW